jgi:subtilisin family serine protease
VKISNPKYTAGRLIKRRLVLVVLLFTVAGVVTLGLTNATVDDPVDERPPHVSVEEMAAEQIIIRYKADVDKAALRQQVSALNAVEKAEIPNLRMKVLKVPKQAREAIIRQLQADPRVEFAEPDGVVEGILTTPNDPELALQWGVPQSTIDLMWDKGRGSDTMTVAVLDSGINASHPDLAGKIATGAKDFINNDSVPEDTSGHGTVVASQIVAKSNNGIGVAGVCWSCKVLPVKVIGANNLATWSAVVQGIDYAASKGAKVINMSFGVVTQVDSLKVAVDDAAAKGILLVAGSANKAEDAAGVIPASYPNVMAVSATNPADELAHYSNFGTVVDIAAPGAARGASHNSDGYTFMHGTSMAAPYVAGIAAVLWSAFPNATAAQIRSAMTSTADTCCAGKISGGRVNAMKAYHKLAGTNPAETTKPVANIVAPTEGLSASGNRIAVSGISSDDVGIATTITGIIGKEYNDARADLGTQAGSLHDITKHADGPLRAVVTAIDTSGNMTRVTRNFTMNNTNPVDKTPPTLSVTAPAAGATISGKSVAIKYTAQDNVLVSMTSVRLDGERFALDVQSPYEVTLDTTKYSNGEHTLQFRAYDTSSHEIIVDRKVVIDNSTVTPPAPPNPPNPPTPPNPPNPNPTPKPGDLNNDGKVNITDLSTLLSNWGKSGVPADINGSGKVDIADLSTLLSNWTR